MSKSSRIFVATSEKPKHRHATSLEISSPDPPQSSPVSGTDATLSLGLSEFWAAFPTSLSGRKFPASENSKDIYSVKLVHFVTIDRHIGRHWVLVVDVTIGKLLLRKRRVPQISTRGPSERVRFRGKTHCV